MPTPTALTTIDNVKTSLNIPTLVTESDARINLLIAEVTSDVQAYCDRLFFAASYTDYRDADGKGRLRVKEPPITDGASLQLWLSTTTPRVYDTTTLQVRGTQYLYDAETGWIFHPNPWPGPFWPKGMQTLKITYPGGFNVIPPRLERAAIEVIQVKLDKGAGRLYHVTSQNHGDGQVSFGSDAVSRFDWPQDAKRVFDDFAAGAVR